MILERSKYAVLFYAEKLQAYYLCLLLKNLYWFDPIINELDKYYTDKIKNYKSFEKKIPPPVWT